MRRSESRRLVEGVRASALVLALALCAPLALSAQSRLDLGGAMLPQGEELRYLRNLALVDSSASFDVTLQPISRRVQSRARANAAASSHPWASRFQSAQQPFSLALGRQFNLQLLRPDASATLLTDRPAALDDGVAWSGRGGNLTLQAGATAEWRWFRAQLAPIAFVAQNADFALAPNSFSDARRFRDSRFPNAIDLPQRFGESSYSRLDLGDSFIDADVGALSFGVSNARQHWGPAREYPLMLGTGSGGFLHFYVGSAEALDVVVGSLNLRLMGAKLEQSPYSPIQSGERSRFLSGAVMSFRPRFAQSLEIGLARLVNGPWPADGFGIGELLLPFEGLINDNTDPINQNDNNGFAGAFVRFAPAGGGLEVYGEMSREDFAGDLRQLYLEPDDLLHYTLGVASARRVGEAIRVLRVELVNGEVNHYEREGRTLSRPIPPYTHSRTRQGLTNRGQLLGSFAAYGGAGATASYEVLSERGRRSITVDRTLLRDWLPGQGITGGVNEGEVTYRLRVEELRFRGDAEWALSVAPTYTLNRNLAQGEDVFGLELGLRWRGW